MSSISLVFDDRQVRDLTRTPRPSTLEELTQTTRHATWIVETQWHDLSQELQDLFRGVAHVIMDPPPIGIWNRLRWAYLILRAGSDSCLEYIEVYGKFRDTLLTTIEREHPDYEGRMADMVTSAIESPPPAMTAEEFREWLWEEPDHPSAG